MSDRCARPARPTGPQSGFSLVELMVAVAIGVFLIAGAVTVFAKTRDLYRTNEDVARLQETARYAMSVIESDLRMANYWGLNSRPDLVGNELPSAAYGTPCGADWSVDVRAYVDGSNANGTTAPYNASLACAPVGTLETDADVLTVRRAGTIALTPAQLTASGARLKVATTRVQASIFNGTSVPAGFVQARNLVVGSYYVARDPAPGDDVLGQPELRRKRLDTTANLVEVDDELVIPGVEDLQFQVGVDSDGDQAADFYINPSNLAVDVPPGDAIVSVRVWLLVRAERPDFSYTNDRTYQYADRDPFALNDRFRRVLLGKTIHLRNTRR